MVAAETTSCHYDCGNQAEADFTCECGKTFCEDCWPAHSKGECRECQIEAAADLAEQREWALEEHGVWRGGR